MIYLLPSKKGNSKKTLPFFIVAVFIVLIFLINLISPAFLGSVSNKIGIPIWKSGGFLSTQFSNIISFAHSRIRILEMNRELESEILNLKTKLLLLDVLENENKEFKRTWGRNDESNGILASVLVKPPQSFYDTLILDAGNDSFVEVGNYVFFGKNVILGTIDEVYKKTSRAKLFSSVDTETVAVVDRNNVAVTLMGRGGGTFEIKVPQEVDIVSGDIIILPGINNNILATVVEIESNPANSFKRVFCKTPTNVAEMRWVSILR
jgi:cell shape-determining protein MreC